MRLQICHLSDIHLASKGNYIEIDEKKDKICNAILSRAYMHEEILFLISGDIVQQGEKAEYEKAMEFFIYIKDALSVKKKIKSYFLFVPGNHDVLFTEYDYDDKLRRNNILSQKDDIEPSALNFILDKMCEKQENFFDFRDLFMGDTNIEIIDSDNKLLIKYKLNISGKDIFINALNTSWISQKHEKACEIFVPKCVYEKIIHKENGLNITMYHHPSNWMHPDDKINFDDVICRNSDMVFIGHEHVERAEHITMSNSELDFEYGDVLQDWKDPNNSAFKLHYIDENDNISSFKYKWDKDVKQYAVVNEWTRKLGSNMQSYLTFKPKHREWLNSLDMQVTHPRKKKVVLSDMFIFPNVEEYNEYGDFADSTKDKITIRGEQLISYIRENKYIDFSGGPKVGKTALTKMISQQMERCKIYTIIVDCKKNKGISLKNIDNVETISIYDTYGKENEEKFRQLSLNQKMIIIDNIDIIKSENERKDIISYLANFYGHIITFTGTSYEVAMLTGTINQDDEVKMKRCVIKDFNNKQRNLFYKKWYMLDEGDGVIVDQDLDKKVKEATETINTLKGNGYMPCIAPNIIIILQQLEFQSDKNQDRSNYGYMYEFLINKATLDMKKNAVNVSDDIANGILINVAQFMLDNKCREIELHEYQKIVDAYNKKHITEASPDSYLNGYIKVDLIELENDQIKFKYPYIHYYFTAKYLANNISKDFAREIIDDMSNNLQDEERGDIMIFLCHLSKEEYIFESVLRGAKRLLENTSEFDFDQYKNININFDEYLDTDFLPEEGKAERQEELLERQDEYEIEREEKKSSTGITTKANYEDEFQKKLEILDAVYKSIEVMGQILKNYPGTVDGTIKLDLLSEVHSLGMRLLTYTHELLMCELEKTFDDISEALYDKMHNNMQEYDIAIDESEIWNQIKTKLTELSVQMDNLFGLLSYSTIRRLAKSLGNEELKPLINYEKEKKVLSYWLMRWSIYLNEFGILQGKNIMNYYDDLLRNKSSFAAKLVKLFVYEHYFVHGSTDTRMRQKIWEKFKFNKKQADRILLNSVDK